MEEGPGGDPDLEAIRARKLAALQSDLLRQRNAPTEPVVLTDETFADFVRGNRLVLIDFWATWCAPCKIVAPHVDAIARDYAGRVAVGKVDTDACPTTARAFGVLSIPTLMIFKIGQPVEQIVGAVPRLHITRTLSRWL